MRDLTCRKLEPLAGALSRGTGVTDSALPPAMIQYIRNLDRNLVSHSSVRLILRCRFIL